VTAPTLGASGVLAALMYHLYTDIGVSKHKLIHAMMVAGIFGNVIKENATISGAIGGCQAEIGSACSMAAAALAYINGLSNELIEYAAEIAMEHHLGLTCDPVGGYVIIPCIERNGAAVLRAVDAVLMAETIGKAKPNRVSFDMVVRTMNYTGKKIALELRETSLGGLATEININPLKE
jgi:L-serine dehydratase